MRSSEFILERFRKLAAWVLMVFLLVSCSTEDASMAPTRWLGPTANGHYPDSGLLKEWSKKGPEILWTFDSLGIGFSSAVIQNGYLFTTGMIDSTGYLYKLDLNGQFIYRVPYGFEWTGSYPGTRGSPTVVGDKIYLVSGKGKLVCFNNENGSIIWSKEYFSDFGGANIIWGINESPVVDGDIVYATPGGKEYNVVALDRHSGDLVWSCKGEGELSAYCTPLLFEHEGRKLLVTYSEAHLLGIDPISGELLWSVDVPTEYSVHFCTPLYEKGEIFFPTGNESGGGKLGLSEDGSSVSVLWTNQVCEYRVSAIYVNGSIYESFSNYDRLTWRCMNWESGEEKFISSELNPGRSVFADGMLYLYTYKGELALVKPDPEEFKVVSQTKVKSGSGLHMAQPMIHKGILYVRHGKSMIAYSI